MCCFIALWQGLNPVLGVIYDFVSYTIYSGSVDTEPVVMVRQFKYLRFKTMNKLHQPFPSSRDYSAVALEPIRSIQRFKKIRMIGSAALSLVHVSSGNEMLRKRGYLALDVSLD